MPKANRPSDKKRTPPYEFSDEVTKRKIRRHLNDINDVISDKDIKNAKVPGTEKKPIPAKPLKEDQGKTDNVVDDTPGNPATPWDVLQGNAVK